MFKKVIRYIRKGIPTVFVSYDSNEKCLSPKLDDHKKLGHLVGKVWDCSYKCHDCDVPVCHCGYDNLMSCLDLDEEEEPLFIKIADALGTKDTKVSSKYSLHAMDSILLGTEDHDFQNSDDKN